MDTTAKHKLETQAGGRMKRRSEIKTNMSERRKDRRGGAGRKKKGVMANKIEVK